MPRNLKGEIVFSVDCPARGDYEATLHVEDFHVNGVAGAPEGHDIIVATFGYLAAERGRAWRHSMDVGDVVPESAGRRIRNLAPDQLQAVGGVICGLVAECPGAGIDSDGLPVCSAFNHDTFMNAVEQVSGAKG